MRHNPNEFGAPKPSETATAMEDTLRFHTDAWDLSVDLEAGFAAMRRSPATSPVRSASYIVK